MTINEFRKEYAFISKCIKRQDAYEDYLWARDNHIWHFGFDVEGNFVKIEPWKVVSDQ